MTRVESGRRGEDCAAELLGRAGCRILARNYRVRGGEIDIIAADGPYIVFVEVKTRAPGGYGSPAEAVDARKRGRILATAQSYLLERPSGLQPRFDVVEVILAGGSALSANWIKDAFGA